MRSRAWVNYLATRREVADLLAAAATASDEVVPGQRMAFREVILRAAMVMLVGYFHAYLEDLVEEWGDLLGSDFGRLSPIGQKYVLLHVQRHLSETLSQYPEEKLGDAAIQVKFRRALEECHDWIENPRSLAASPDRFRLEGFFRRWGAGAIDKALAHFREDGVGFFSWLRSQHPSYADYYVRLHSAITVRNEVAHGSFQARLTTEDVRRHRATLTLLVRKAESFLGGALEEAYNAASEAAKLAPQ